MARRFTKSTKGFNGPVFVAPPIDITTDASILLFLANAPTGEFGVYDVNDALHTNAITSSEKFYFVQKLAGGIKRTPLLALTDVVVTKKAYVAPVKQVSSIGWTGTGGGLNPPTLAAGQTFEFAVIETTEGYEPFPSWNYTYTTRTNDTQMEIMQAFAAQVNDLASLMYKINEPLVTAKVKADGTYGNYAATTGSTFTLIATNGSATFTYGGTTPTYDVAVGDYISFDAAATPTDAVGDIYKVISVTAAVGFTVNRPYQGATQTFTEAEAEGTRVKKVTAVVAAGLQLTAKNFDEHFRIAVRDLLEDADITYTTPFTKGNGTYDEVYSDETEGEIWEGDTAKNSEFAVDYGQQGRQSVSGETYDCYIIQFTNRKSAIAPNSEDVHKGTIFIWVAKSAGNVDTSLDTYFGL